MAAARVVSIHGLPVAWRVTGVVDPLASFVGAFDTTDAAPVLDVHLRARHPEASVRGDVDWARGAAPSYFHGRVQALAAEDRWIFTDGASQARLSADARTLEVDIAEGAESDALTAGLVHMALLHALRVHGMMELHAAGAIVEGAPVLLVGASGSGKTTTLLALLEGGARFLGDDRVLLRRVGGELELLAYPRAFHVAGATLRAFGHLAVHAAAGAGPDGKRDLDARAAYAGALALVARGPALLVFPSVVDAPTSTVATLSSADALGLLIESSAGLLVDGMPGRDENLACLRLLASSSKRVALRLGADALGAPAVVRALVDAARGAS